MARTTPMVRGEILTWDMQAHERQIRVGTPAWFAWLEGVSTFAFLGSSGTFTARKEPKPNGGVYWKAYRKCAGKLRRAYLGKSEDVTLERLNTIAARLANQSSPVDRVQDDAAVPGSGLSADFPTLSTQDASPTTLPVQLTAFIGREQEVAIIRGMLLRREVRLLTLTGPGGVGKTRLLLAVAQAFLPDFAGKVCFVSLAAMSDPDFVLSAITQALGLRETATRSVLQEVQRAIGEQSLLLLLDNFEHVLSAAPKLADLLAFCPQVIILVSSRAPLRLQGEREFAVSPLPLPDLKHLPAWEDLAHSAACMLFIQRAQAIKPEFQLTEANSRTIGEICVRLDGLPLAIELAAARTRLLSPHALLARLSHRLDVLTGGARDLPARQQTMRATITWSYQLLAPSQQQLFRFLAVFAGGCTLSAIEALMKQAGMDGVDVLEEVSTLLENHLVLEQEQPDGEPRLRLLETIREYGLEALAAAEELQVARRAHAHCYLRLAEEAAAQLTGPQQAVWFDRLERDYRNVRAALLWALEQGEAGYTMEMALRLSGALRRFWVVRWHVREGLSFLERALAKSEEVAASVRAKALDQAAGLALFSNERDRAEVLLEESLALWRDLGDIKGIATALYRLGTLAMDRCHFLIAYSLTEEALTLFRECGSKMRIAWATSQLASIVSEQGQYTRAWTLYEECLAIYREMGDKTDSARMLEQLAWVLFVSHGDQDTIRSLLEGSRPLLREVGDTSVLGALFLARLALQQDDIATARRLAEECVSGSRETDDQYEMAQSLSLLASVHERSGDFTTARAFYEKSLTIARHMDLKGIMASGLEGLAAVVAAQGELPWSARLWGAADALRDTLGTPLPPVCYAEYEHSVAAVRTQLGEQSFAAAWAEGQSMTPEQALATPPTTQISTQISPSPPPAAPARKSVTYPAGLTAREVEVLRLIAQGLSNAQIAEHLVISPHTVNHHTASLYNKLGVSSRAAATHSAYEHHLL